MMHAAPGRPERYDRPRFRQDLVAESIDDQGARFIDVMDPDSGSIFRFYEVEYSLACAMDGQRDVPGIVKWAQEELGLTPSQQEVRTVIATLGDLGFIDAGEAAAAPPTPEPARGVASAAHVKVEPPADLGAGRTDVPAHGPLPTAPAVPLGVPAATAKRPVQTPGDSAQGAPGRGPVSPTPSSLSSPPASPPARPPATSASEVSIDLSDHIEVRPADVKEAVRASKVMSAVDVPQDLLDAIEDRPSTRSTEATRPAARAPEVSRPPEAMPPARAEARPEARVDARADAPAAARTEKPISRPPETASTARPPVELPEPPVPVTKPVAPTAPSARVSPILIVLLILAVLGGGAFFVWKYVLEKQDGNVGKVGTSTEPAPPAVKPPAPAPPPPPPAPTSKIVLETRAPDEVKISRAGVIETILANNTAVKVGDLLVKLVGDKPIEAEIASLTREEKRARDLIDAVIKRRDAAQAAGNKAAEAAAQGELAERQKTVEAKQAQLDIKAAELDKFLLNAPSSGTFMPVAKLGQKIAADDVVAKIQRDVTATATFKVADAKPFAVAASVFVDVVKGEQRVTCTIAEVQPDSVKVACPADPALAEGTDVTFTLTGATPEIAPGAAPGTAPVPAPGTAPVPTPGK